MKYNISTNLLKEIFKVKTITRVQNYDKNITIYHEGTCIENSIQTDNIYSFAHKCKTFAMLEGYQIKTWFDEITCWCTIHKNNKKVKSFSIQGPEQQAIINACEWVLQNKISS